MFWTKKCENFILNFIEKNWKIDKSLNETASAVKLIEKFWGTKKTLIFKTQIYEFSCTKSVNW